MHARRICDLAHHLLLVDVDHLHLCAMADVEPPGILINGQVIPATFAADRDLLEELIRTFCAAIRNRQGAEQAECGHTEKPTICLHKFCMGVWFANFVRNICPPQPHRQKKSLCVPKDTPRGGALIP